MSAIQDKPFILMGCGGHARVVADVIRTAGHKIAGVLDPAQAKGAMVLSDIEVLGGDDYLEAIDSEAYYIANCVGPHPDVGTRKKISEMLDIYGFTQPVICHPSAIISKDTDLGGGVQLMAGSIVQPGCTIGKNTVINTGAQVDHDTSIAEYCHIAPGAVLCGGVSVAEQTTIGPGATIAEGISIGSFATVGAGATVLSDVPSGAKVYGTPAKTRGGK